MPSINALSMMAAAGIGAGTAGYIGFQHAKGDDTFDSADVTGFTTSSAIAGTIGGLAINAYGAKRLATTAKYASQGLYLAGRGLTANPGKAALRALGRKKFGLKSLPGPVKGSMGLLAITAAAVGLVAYGASKSDPQSTTNASPDGYGGTSYGSSVRERMGLLGATGDMVFGLNNLRHGG